MEAKRITIHTPWEELEARFAAILDMNTNDEEEEYTTSNFESSFTVRNRPILPPLMTTAKRRQCRQWREQAVGIQQKLHRSYSGHVGNDDAEDEEISSESESEVVYVRSQSSSSLLSLGRMSVAEFHNEGLEKRGQEEQMAMSGAFKALIHRLRGELVATRVEQDVDDGERWHRPHYHESTQSINTVVENPNFSLATADDIAPVDVLPLSAETVVRSRSNSYTLDEPSPLLRAYMDKYGDGDMSFASVKTTVSSPMKRRDAKLVLHDYLASLSAMPQLRRCPRRNEIVQEATAPEELVLAASHAPPKTVEVDAPAESLGLDDISLASSAIKSSTLPPMSARSDLEVEQDRQDIKGNEYQTIDRKLPQAFDEGDNGGASAGPIPAFSSPMDLTGSTSRRIESAVSSLAQEQDKKIQDLIKEQEQQRIKLHQYFQEQRQSLIDQIMVSVKTGAPTRHQNQTHEYPQHLSRRTPLPFDLPPRSGSPVLPAAVASFRPMSILPADYFMPPEALTSEMHAKFCKLTAAARGYLTRRLMRTHKVQYIVASIRDTMSTALQLHAESARKGSGSNSSVSKVSPQDVELHRRLLQQINRDCQMLHHIFFETGLPERMSVIAMDHEIRKRNESIKQIDRSQERRVSAATLARMEEKQRIVEATSTNSPTRQSGITRKPEEAYGNNSASVANKENRPARARSTSIPRGKRISSSTRRSLYNISGESNNAYRRQDNQSPFFRSNSTSSVLTKKRGRDKVTKRSKKPWK